jgi:hypothetical protein
VIFIALKDCDRSSTSIRIQNCTLNAIRVMVPRKLARELCAMCVVKKAQKKYETLKYFAELLTYQPYINY